MVWGARSVGALLGSAFSLLLGCSDDGPSGASETDTGPTTSATLPTSATGGGESTGLGPTGSASSSAGEDETGSDPSASGETATTSEGTGTTDTTTSTTDATDTTGTTGATMKPDDAPDWVIIAVSGHCIPPGCDLPGTNHEYLTKVGTTERIAAVLTDAGASVEIWAYSDELYNRDAQTSQLLPGEGEPIYFGFLQLHEDLNALRDGWIAGFDDPTRVLVVAHSHGVVWAHTALHVVDDLPVELAIDLDGVSMGWEEDSLLAGFGDDWDDVIAQYNQTYGATWPFDLGDAEAGWSLPGIEDPQDTEDVLPDSVLINLELQSQFSLLFPFPDDDDNHRLGGGNEMIYRYSSDGQDHFEIYQPNGDAMDWVVAQMIVLLDL